MEGFRKRFTKKNTNLLEKVPSINLGLCCVNTELKKRNIFCSRKPIVRTVLERGIDYLKTQCLANCRDLLTLLEWNVEYDIRVMRISSELFPHITNSKIPEYDIDFATEILSKIGEYARLHQIRLTFHPGQYNIVGALREEVFLQTLKELDYHARVLDAMNCPPDSVIVIHGGGVYGDKEKTIDRWCLNFARLPDRVQRRLVLENCEKCFSVIDCLQISQKIKKTMGIPIPIVFDTHHYDCYNLLHPTEKLEPAENYMPAILETWKQINIKPKFHISEQREGARIGAHSDMIQSIPSYLLDIPDKYGVAIDIMVEAKLKERAIMALRKNLPRKIKKTIIRRRI